MYVKCFENSTSTKGVTGIVQRHGRRLPVAQRTVVRPVASNTVIGFSTIQCKSLVHREGVDNDLRRGHEKTAPIWRKSPGLPWRGGQRSEERTREDSANQTRVPWSTVKGWTTIWGEDTRRRRQSDVSPLVHHEGVDNDLRRGCKKTVPVRCKSTVPWSTVKGWTMTWGEDAVPFRRKSPGPPWSGGWQPEETEDTASGTEEHRWGKYK